MRLSNLNPRSWKRAQPEQALDEIAEVVPDSLSLKLAPHLLLGARGERLAAERLEQLGYTLVASNFTLPVGRNLRGAFIQAELLYVAFQCPLHNVSDETIKTALCTS